ncbi:MAG: Asp-tRNA(Asn)/Glu-tRNA(Gln) amidotransferase subunit GatA [Saccharofermentanales bacterium]|jgi:aspartyl-tRNA(Asn)/glutamyl-tRNA(Gln) amidotransferase subunit A|nr:Asp-tRNA(Asn)/Glu-tRNA(Gln) amidotransferase subunit GatA [Bacillota bacterium]
MDMQKMNLTQMAAALRAGEFSAVELTRHYLAQIEAQDESINAYITVTSDQALAQAAKVDQALMSGKDLPPLAGLPLALKDNICTKGILTTAASKMLSAFVPPYSAYVWLKLQDQMGVLLGKTNLDEFALGTTNETSFFGPTKNPLDLTRIPGGSSGGSAAAVAAGTAAYALGSDTGGSVRLPAAHCGLVGMRPTYGLVSRRGVIPLAPSMDQVGPLTRSLADNALVLSAIAGHDPQDAVSADRATPDFSAGLDKGVKDLRIGLTPDYLETKVTADFKAAVLKTAADLETAGAKIVELTPRQLESAFPAYYLLTSAEVSSAFGRLDGIHYGYRSQDYEDLEDIYYNSRSEGFGPEVKRRIMLGNFVLSADYYEAFYVKAQKVRTFVKQEFDRMLEQVDLILLPTTTDTTPKLGTKKDRKDAYNDNFFSVLAPLTGLPALSVPTGSRVEGLPVSVQLTGPAFSEALLYQAGAAIMGGTGEETA